MIYTRFYANALPLIVCEGKTDGVYISNAVHQTKSIFPSLVRKDKDGKDVLSFQLLKYARKHKKKDTVYLPNYSTITILGAVVVVVLISVILSGRIMVSLGSLRLQEESSRLFSLLITIAGAKKYSASSKRS